MVYNVISVILITTEGVGAVTANIWWNLGYKTLQDVLDKAKISPAVRLGITLLPDFSQL